MFRPTILRSFGWRVLDVPGKDWLRDPAAVLARIEGMLATGADRALAVELAPAALQHRMAPPAVAAGAAPLAPPETPEAPGAPTHMRSLRFEHGGSRKFWKGSVSGAALSVTYGRIGSGGQTLVKEFDSAERALRELGKLSEEKLRKGYVEE